MLWPWYSGINPPYIHKMPVLILDTIFKVSCRILETIFKVSVLVRFIVLILLEAYIAWLKYK